MKKIILATIIIVFLSFSTQTQAAWYDIFRWSNIKENFRESKERREEAKKIQEEEKKRQQNGLLNKNQNTEADSKEQAQQKENIATTEPQTINTNIEITQEQKPAASFVDTELDAKAIENLKTEVTTLTTNLDKLYKAHNNLVNDHNELLKYTTDLEKRHSVLQNQPIANNVSPDILYRISELERKAKLTSNELYGDGLSKSLNLRVSNLESFSNSGNDRKISDLESKISGIEREVKDICRDAFGEWLGCSLFRNNDLDGRIKKLEREY